MGPCTLVVAVRPRRSLLSMLILLAGACGETPTMGGDGGDAGRDAATSDADVSPVVDVVAPMIP